MEPLVRKRAKKRRSCVRLENSGQTRDLIAVDPTSNCEPVSAIRCALEAGCCVHQFIVVTAIVRVSTPLLELGATRAVATESLHRVLVRGVYLLGVRQSRMPGQSWLVRSMIALSKRTPP